MMYSNKYNMPVCRVCGGATIAGTMDCPRCQQISESRKAAYLPKNELRPCWNNASHDGVPAGFRIIGGRYHGMLVKVVET